MPGFAGAYPLAEEWFWVGHVCQSLTAVVWSCVRDVADDVLNDFRSALVAGLRSLLFSADLSVYIVSFNPS